MKPFPNKIPLANLPTKIEKLERFSEQTGISVYIKRDDLTGMEYSGNKIRKLEYAVRRPWIREPIRSSPVAASSPTTAALRQPRR